MPGHRSPRSATTLTALAASACLVGGPAETGAQVALDSGNPPEDQALQAALEAPHRAASRRARDRYLHPYETLRFFRLRPDQYVIELWPDAGWLSEILAPYLADSDGRFQAVNYVPEGARVPLDLERSAVLMQTRVDAELHELRGMELRGYQTSMEAPLAPIALEELAPPGTVDLMLSLDDAQRWLALGLLDQILAAASRALAPDGRLGIVAPRAPDEWSIRRQTAYGYISEATLIAAAYAQGLTLADASQINANSGDARDHAAGAWTLPPHLRLGEAERERYQAIGEPDRLTIVLRKPR